jgi:hypothetical protein
LGAGELEEFAGHLEFFFAVLLPAFEPVWVGGGE